MHIFHVLEPFLSYGSKLYLLASELFTVTTLLTLLSISLNLITKVYDAGAICGKFFYKYELDLKIRFVLVHLITFLVLILSLSIEGALVVKRDHRIWLENINTFRNLVGSFFVLPDYASQSKTNLAHAIW